MIGGSIPPGRSKLRSLLVVGAALLSPALVAFGQAARSPEVATAPNFDAKTHQVEYTGPGREDPVRSELADIAIGYFGPGDADHPLGGDLWLASSLAVDQANAAGGYRGIPYRVVQAWSDNPWGTGAADVARMVYADGVWGIVGSIDGASTHLAEQVVAKARVTLVGPVSTDKTVNMANVAWAFSCMPPDDSQARVLGHVIAERAASGRGVVLVSATDHDSRVAATELISALARAGVAPKRHVQLDPAAAEHDALARQVVEASADDVVVLAGPVDSARLAAALHDQRASASIFGGPAMGRRVFREIAGPAAEGVVFPALCDASFATGEFASAFRSRFGREPDCAAAQAFDATRLLIEAIEAAGPNRARIRDAVEDLSPWAGAAGEIRWNGLGQNRRTVALATIREGRVVVLAPDPADEEAARTRSSRADR